MEAIAQLHGLIERLKHLPGKHNQSDHASKRGGRGGASGGSAGGIPKGEPSQITPRLNPKTDSYSLRVFDKEIGEALSAVYIPARLEPHMSSAIRTVRTDIRQNQDNETSTPKSLMRYMRNGNYAGNATMNAERDIRNTSIALGKAKPGSKTHAKLTKQLAEAQRDLEQYSPIEALGVVARTTYRLLNK